jgi:MFS family permease
MSHAVAAPFTVRDAERNILRFYAYQFAGNLALWAPIWVLYLQQDRGLSLTQITALDAPFWLLAIVAEVPTGTVADRWGRKASLLLGAVVYALALFLFGLGENYLVLMLSYLTWPVALALQSGADSAFLYDSLAMVGRESQFRKVLGRSQAINSVGFLLGSLIGAPLAAATSLAFPILASAALMLLAALAALTFREPRHQSDAPPQPYLKTMGTAIRHAYAVPPLRWMIGVRAAIMGAGLVMIIFTQPFLASFDVPVAQFGLATTPVRLLAIAAALSAYRLAAALGERRLLWSLGIVTAAALLATGLVDSLAAFAMFAVVAMTNAVTSTITGDYINRHAPQALRATVMSVAQMAFSLVLLVAEPTLGLIADRSSLQTMFLAAAAGIGLLATLTLAAWTAASNNADRANHRDTEGHRGHRDVASSP